MSIDVKEFKPTRDQQMAKARLHKYLDSSNAMIALEDMSLEAIVTAAKSERMRKWITQSEFADWLYDRDTVNTKIVAYSEIALERLYEIITSPIDSGKDAKTTTKDILAASKLLLELADKFPKGTTKVVFADKELNGMNDDEVQKQLNEYKAKLLGVGHEGK